MGNKAPDTDNPVGKNVSQFCKSLGISRTTFYRHVIVGSHPPEHARVGDRVIIIERPEDYLRRIAALRGA